MNRDIWVRLGGLAAIAIGAFCLWFFLLLPLQQAQSGADAVSYSLRAFVLVPFCLVFGVAFLVAGERFEYRNADHKNFTMTGWITFAVVVVLTGLGWWWFEQQFTALGYV